MCGETHKDKNKNRLKTYFGAICKKRCNVSTCYEHLNLDVTGRNILEWVNTAWPLGTLCPRTISGC